MTRDGRLGSPAAPSSLTRGSDDPRLHALQAWAGANGAKLRSGALDGASAEQRGGAQASPTAPRSGSRYSEDPRVRAAQAWAEKSGIILGHGSRDTPVTGARVLSPVEESAERKRQQDAEAEERRKEWIGHHVRSGEFAKAADLGWHHDKAAKRIGLHWRSALRRWRLTARAPSAPRGAGEAGDRALGAASTGARVASPLERARDGVKSPFRARDGYGAMRTDAEERSPAALEQLAAQLRARDEQLREANAELARREHAHEQFSRELHMRMDQALSRIDVDAGARAAQAARIRALESKLDEDVTRERDAAAVARVSAAEEMRAMASARDAALARADALELRLAEAEARLLRLRRTAEDVRTAAGAAGDDASARLSHAVGVFEAERGAHVREVQTLRAQLEEREAATQRALERATALRSGEEEELARARTRGAAEGGMAAQGALSGYQLQLMHVQAQLEDLQAKRSEGARAVLAEVEALTRELALVRRSERDARADAAAAAERETSEKQQLFTAKAETERALVLQMERARRATAELEARAADTLDRREMEFARREAAAEQRAHAARREADGLRELLAAARDETASSAARAASEAQSARDAQARVDAQLTRARTEHAALLHEAHAREEEARAAAAAAEEDGDAAARALAEADQQLEVARAEVARARALRAEIDAARADADELRAQLARARDELDGQAAAGARERERAVAADAAVEETDRELVRARDEISRAIERAADADAARERADELASSAQTSLLRLTEQLAELEASADEARRGWARATAELAREREESSRKVADAFAQGAASGAAADTERAVAAIATAAATESELGAARAEIFNAAGAAPGALTRGAGGTPAARWPALPHAPSPAGDSLSDAALFVSVLGDALNGADRRAADVLRAQAELRRALGAVGATGAKSAPPASRALVDARASNGGGAALLAPLAEAERAARDMAAELSTLKASLFNERTRRPLQLSHRPLAVAVRRLTSLVASSALIVTTASAIASDCEAMAADGISALPAGCLSAARAHERAAAACARAPIADASVAMLARATMLPDLARERAARGLGPYADATDAAAARSWLSIIASVALALGEAGSAGGGATGARPGGSPAEPEQSTLGHAIDVLAAVHAREPTAQARGTVAAHFASGGGRDFLPAHFSSPASSAHARADDFASIASTLTAELSGQRPAAHRSTQPISATTAAARRRVHQAAIAGYLASEQARAANY
ncbi:hypothetical protein KFE25_008852 [Diacronema lutheri]|uniref:Uncharacterized protein n=1 Tax=Diacronema lutheri TaxID=2081491 RepID=A0A8J5XWP5_DIALT|nr:hypothetical protein KFE25_008852 [Diacronema lutheri]